MLIEQIYKLYDKEEKYLDRNSFFVSEVDKCPRAIFYSFKKTPKAKLKPEVYLKFEDGDDTHRRLIKALFRLGILVATEVKMPNNDLFSGRADAVVNIKNELFIVEIKSVSSYRFQKLARAPLEYVKQIQLYLYFFNVNKGIILIENKNTQKLKEFVVKKDMGLIKQMFADFERLKIQIVNDELPESPKDLPEWKCSYCSYREICERK